MNLFIDTHQQLIKALLKAEVSFIIIGGYSVIFHGYTRMTGDIDIWLKPDNVNKEKLVKALAIFGIDDESLIAVRQLDFNKTVLVFFSAILDPSSSKETFSPVPTTSCETLMRLCCKPSTYATFLIEDSPFVIIP